MPKCEACQSHRRRLFRCITCGKGLCGCCSFKSRAGRVCPGKCHQLALAKTDKAENATAGVVIARASLTAVLHQMEQGEASDVFDIGIVNPDTQRDLRWCRDQLKEALAAIS